MDAIRSSSGFVGDLIMLLIPANPLPAFSLKAELLISSVKMPNSGAVTNGEGMYEDKNGHY